MLDTLLAVLALLVPIDDAEALRRSAPTYLTVETARLHVAAARVAAGHHGVDPDLVLSIAWFESRYTPGARSSEPGGKTSCGVMTPVPKYKCETPTMLAGYFEGAEHLRVWFDACRGNATCAMRGFAGGWSTIRACAAGPVMQERAGRSVDVCMLVEARHHRARWIRRLRSNGSVS